MTSPLTVDFDSAVEAYEAARERDPGAALDLSQFALPPSHPDYAAAIVELVRVDMEHTWRPADHSRLDRYRALFPEALSDQDALGAIAYEEYRLRVDSGEQVDRAEYRRKYGCDVSDWGPEAPTSDSSPQEESTRLDPATFEPFPALGETIWDFELIEVLGEGAGGRVFLARQTGLASRLVVLKITRGPSREPQQLAQLQHTNIVPIYSFHRRGELCGVCMPFLGRTTLAHLLAACRQQGDLPETGLDLVTTIAARQDETRVASLSTVVSDASFGDGSEAHSRTGWQHIAGRPYVDSVAWIGARLAEGLAHAHQKGIVHRDLKPANVLLGEDGQPLLLDFHLSAQSERRNSSEVIVGGTIPYLAPECIDALGGPQPCLDPRSDIYALGVLLYEMLTGELPFAVHRGPLESAARSLLQDRRQPPSPCPRNQAVSPGLASIVARCLAFDPQQRYASALDLSEDLQRHLDHRPLRFARDRSLVERAGKWARRHPRLSSATTIGIAALVALVALAGSWMIRGHQLAAARSRESLLEFRRQAGDAAAVLDIPGVDDQSLKTAVSRAEEALSQYAVTSDPAWTHGDAVAALSERDRANLKDEVSSLLYLLAAGRGQQAVRCADAAERQRLLALALEANRLGQATVPGNRLPRAFRLQEARLLAAERGSAAPMDEGLDVREEPTSFEDRYLLAVELAHRRRYADALGLLEDLVRQRPQDARLWLGLGICSYELGQYPDANGYFGTSIAMRPELVLAYVYRAVSRLKLRAYDGALADCNSAIALDPKLPAVFFNRALAQDGLGRRKAAVDDLTQALVLGSTETRLYFLRSQWRRSLGDRDGAAADHAAGLRLTPRDELSFVARGLARLHENPDAALADFQDALRLNPASRSALQNMSVVYGETMSRPELAIGALDRLIEVAPHDSSAVASRGVYHARAGHRDAALRDAAAALKLDGEQLTHYRVGCIYALTSRSEPADAARAVDAIAQALKKAPALSSLAASDSDLEPIRQNARFQALLAAARQLQTATDAQMANGGR